MIGDFDLIGAYWGLLEQSVCCRMGDQLCCIGSVLLPVSGFPLHNHRSSAHTIVISFSDFARPPTFSSPAISPSPCARVQSWQQRLTEAQVAFHGQTHAGDAAARASCHLENVNEDAQLSGVIVHPLHEGRCLVGRSSAPPPADYAHKIALGGASIQDEHAVLHRMGRAVTLYPLPGAQVVLNGQRLAAPAALQDADRIVLAPNQVRVWEPGAMVRAKVECPSLNESTPVPRPYHRV